MNDRRGDQAAALRDGGGHGRPEKPVRVIAVTSGKGGVGKTNIVANTAIAMARQGHRVLIMDADLSLANLDILLGLDPDWNIGHVLTGEAELRDILVEGPEGIRILPASTDSQGLTQLTDEQKLILRDQIEGLKDEVDVFIIDTSAGIGNNVIFFNKAAQDRLVIVTPEPTSITDAYALIKVLYTEHHQNTFLVLINQARSQKEAREVFKKLAAAADHFLPGVGLDYLGAVPLDANIPRAVRQQRAVIEVYPSSPASRSFAGLARKLLEMRNRPGLEGGFVFFWQDLFSMEKSV